MAYAIKFDEEGERFYEVGTKHGVIYPWDTTLNSGKGGYGNGVAWNGLTGVTESPSGGDETSFWADDMKYFTRRGNEEFGLTIKAFYYPDEFAECDGTKKIANGIRIRQQVRKRFGFTWETTLGNDTEGDAYGSIIHIAYGVTASPSSKDDSTINDSADVSDFSWECSTTPITVPGSKPTSVIDIDLSDANVPAGAESWLRANLYGYVGTESDEFSTTRTYAIGDIVRKTLSQATGKLYICTTAVTTAGEWNENNWEELADSYNLAANIPSIDAMVSHFGAVANG